MLFKRTPASIDILPRLRQSSGKFSSVSAFTDREDGTFHFAA